MYANYHESRKKLMQNDGRLKDILMSQEEQLTFKVSFK